MKILVSGASGYIGGYVIDELLKQGHEVIGTSRRIPKKDIEFIPHDFFLDYKTNLYKKFQKPDALIHCGWEKVHDYNNLLQFDNIKPSYDFIKKLGVDNITLLGTCFEYGLKDGEIKEDSEPNHLKITRYGEAKRILSLLLPESVKKLKLFYNYGKGQRMFDSLVNCKDVFNTIDENQYRDYLHIQQVAEYIVKACLNTELKGNINICSGKPKQVIELMGEINPNIKLNIGMYPKPDYEGDSFYGCNKKMNFYLT